MCDPLTIGSLALTAGGMVANNVAQNRVEKAREGAMSAERIRQQKLDQETEAANLHARDNYKDFEGEQGERASSLGDFFASQNTDIPASASGGVEAETPTEMIPTNASNVVNSERSKQLTKTKEYSDQQAAALGNLRAFGDLLGEKSREQVRDAGIVGQINGFKRGSSAVLPYELEAANSKGDGMKLFADVLSGLGSIGTGVGLSKGGYNLFGLNSSGVGGPVSTIAGSSTTPAGAAGLTYMVGRT